jgi:uncharacterized membrane protein YedE/YeeE
MVQTVFSPVPALAGGALIGLAAVLLLGVTGRIAGISGITARLLPPYADRAIRERLGFILGLIAAPLLLVLLTGEGPAITVDAEPLRLAIAGLLVGFGAVYGGGCTSGHGVCGLARWSKRSLVATLIFMTTAIVTVFLSRHLWGG